MLVLRTISISFQIMMFRISSATALLTIPQALSIWVDAPKTRKSMHTNKKNSTLQAELNCSVLFICMNGRLFSDKIFNYTYIL